MLKMLEQMKYRIVKATGNYDGFDEFERQCTELMDDGFEVLGVPFTLPDGTLAQAFVCG